MKRLDKDGDDQISKQERAALREARQRHHHRILKQFDKEGNEKLSKKERVAVKEWRDKRSQKLPDSLDQNVVL